MGQQVVDDVLGDVAAKVAEVTDVAFPSLQADAIQRLALRHAKTAGVNIDAFADVCGTVAVFQSPFFVFRNCKKCCHFLGSRKKGTTVLFHFIQ
jgi:hypothetical protein